VRDPALLTCRAFASAKPIKQQTWHIRLSAAGIQAVRDSRVKEG
jgi:hypothetical protein